MERAILDLEPGISDEIDVPLDVASVLLLRARQIIQRAT
jgi:hypothetical protein